MIPLNRKKRLPRINFLFLWTPSLSCNLSPWFNSCANGLLILMNDAFPCGLIVMFAFSRVVSLIGVFCLAGLVVKYSNLFRSLFRQKRDVQTIFSFSLLGWEEIQS